MSHGRMVYLFAVDRASENGFEYNGRAVLVDKFFHVVSALALFVMTGVTLAQDDQSGTWSVTGECKRLIIRSENLTSSCTGDVIRTKFPDGTATFAFSDGKDWLVFRTKDASKRLWQGYRTIVVIDHVAVDPIGSKPGPFIEAGGHCTYGAPYFGQADISCSAMQKFRMWAADVETDGVLPVPDSEYIAPTMAHPRAGQP